jgi:2-oxoglutarate dehydrogenase E2 component (dihydrolipoamide succinyltransferase)
MATVDMVMPKMGESIMEATILKWHKKPGDTVRIDETILEIATDKVDSEVPSIEEGVVEQLLFKENDVVPVGAVIARIKTNVSESVSSFDKDEETSRITLKKQTYLHSPRLPIQPLLPRRLHQRQIAFTLPLYLTLLHKRVLAYQTSKAYQAQAMKEELLKKIFLIS